MKIILMILLGIFILSVIVAIGACTEFMDNDKH